jgi:hypothetical protein
MGVQVPPRTHIRRSDLRFRESHCKSARKTPGHGHGSAIPSRSAPMNLSRRAAPPEESQRPDGHSSIRPSEPQVNSDRMRTRRPVPQNYAQPSRQRPEQTQAWAGTSRSRWPLCTCSASWSSTARPILLRPRALRPDRRQRRGGLSQREPARPGMPARSAPRPPPVRHVSGWPATAGPHRLPPRRPGIPDYRAVPSGTR